MAPKLLGLANSNYHSTNKIVKLFTALICKGLNIFINIQLSIPFAPRFKPKSHCVSSDAPMNLGQKNDRQKPSAGQIWAL